MDGIESIRKQITDDAALKIAEIEKKQQEERANILAEAEKTAKAEYDALIERGKKEQEREHEIIMSQAASDSRMNALKAKQQLIDEVYEKASLKFQSVSGQEYEDQLLKLILENAKGGEEIIFPENDGADHEKLVSLASSKLSSALKLSSEHADFSKGFVLKKGHSQISCSFEKIAEYMKEQLVADLSKKLFP